MKLDNIKKRYSYRLIVSIFSVALLCLVGVAFGVSNTRTAQAASSAKQSREAVTPVIQSIRMVSQSVGWATANTSTILHTVTGGNHWTNVTPHYSVAKPQFFIATFKDAQHGWIAYEPQFVNNTFTILRTTNGGVSWQSSTVSVVSGIGVAALTFNGTLDGWVLVGDDGGPGAGSESFALFSTINGGQTWTRLPDIHTSDQVNGLSFVNAQNGYLTYGIPAPNPYMSVTHNGGHSWQQVILPAVKGAPEGGNPTTTPPVIFGSTGYLPVGMQEGTTLGFEIFTSHNGGTTWLANGSFVTLGNNTRLGGVGDLYIVDPTHFYVTNQQGKTLLSTNGGVSWHTLSGTVGSGVTSLSFINAQQGWAAGNGLLHTNNGGVTWQKVNYTV